MVYSKLSKIVKDFEKKKILVVGDLMLDEYVFGNVERISPEAPVPVVHIRSKSYTPGGAANVANNIVSLGAKIVLVGIIGKDESGRILKEKLQEKGIETSSIIIDKNRPTITKQRIIAQTQQIVRIDTEEIGPPQQETQNQIEKIIYKHKDIDAILISDYDKGLITTRLIEYLVVLGLKQNIPVTVDPHITHFFMYNNVTVLTPNHKELATATSKKIHNEAELIQTAQDVMKRLNSKYFIVTRGEEGMTIFYKDGKYKHIPTLAREVYDVTGAGDTVIAILTLCLSLN
ncbi:MAG: D-glycero-beta-D-manno-heptose-7-phosphate kinase, partial [Candidatus Hydrogenedentota bacterium]